MVKRAEGIKRTHKPLFPDRAIHLVINDDVVTYEPQDIRLNTVGHKAYGLASLPVSWTKPFFVVPHDSRPTKNALIQALALSHIDVSAQLIVRSSGVDESLDQRGSLDSICCDVHSLIEQIAILRNGAANDGQINPVHWVVQEEITARTKGHLSNERRVAEDKRDWIAEVEASATHATESHRISLRTWRDNRKAGDEALACPYKEMYIDNLQRVAKWAYERLIRVHFEWVWNGNAIFIVQADSCDEVAGGVLPETCVQKPKENEATTSDLRLFHEANQADFQNYRKLANAQLYSSLNYSMVTFYVFDLSDELKKFVETKKVSEDFFSDLKQLTKRPLVIRTDGCDIPHGLRQMLPRSEELRSPEQAQKWLLDEFGTKVTQKDAETKVRLLDCRLCLIAHHFIPAIASAWCQARPDHRRVRIESLWGIPEGLYWHAYDAFDVDTSIANLAVESVRPSNMLIREKRRFKEHFIAPDSSGRWILHRSAAGPDWQRSITRTEWLEEIAWTSRLIAARAGKPVVVMWFIGIPATASGHKVLPWYHEPWSSERELKAAPRKKLTDSSDFILGTRSNWTKLQSAIASGASIARVRVQPKEPDIVRDQEFAKELGTFATKNKIVIELEGGILSHAYYMLSRAGCVVECADLDDYATDEYKLEFNKLVRDKIPDVIVQRGESVTLFRLRGEALIEALRRKIVEEALEVLDARTNDEIAEELADLREVELALMARLDILEADVEAKRRKKQRLRGGFDAALMLSKTAIAPSLTLQNLDFELVQQDGLHLVGTIEKTIGIPAAFDEIHVDKRLDAAGIAERQFTVDLPAHAAGFRLMRVSFSLETQNGTNHEMILELKLDRKNSDLRLKARIINTPQQLQLDLNSVS